MSLELPFGITPTNPVYVDAYRGPYTDITEALSTVPEAVRVLGQVVFIEGLGEYWWKDNVTDADLIEKTSAASFPFNLESNITGTQFSLITANYGVDLNVPLFLIRNETSVDLINTKADLIIGAGNLNGDLEAKTRNIHGHNNVNLAVAGEDIVVVGSNNVKNSTGDKLVIIGNNNQPIATSGEDVLIGNSIFSNALTSQGFNIALGTSAGGGFQNVSFGNNIIGAYAAYAGTGDLADYNNLIGAVAYNVNDIGSSNNLMGYLVAQNAVSIDDHNVLIGSYVAQNVNNVTDYNTFIGYRVAQDATGTGVSGSNDWNTGIGALALENADLSSLDLTTAIGASSMKFAGGERNTAVGNVSGWDMKGSFNTALGARSGKSSDSNIISSLDGASNGDGTKYEGQRSTFVGYDSGYEAAAAALNDMLVIGTYFASEEGATYISAVSNLYLISNTGTTEVKLKLPNVYGQPNQVLTDVLGNGELSWQDTTSLNDSTISSTSTWSSDKINSSFQSIGGKRLRKVESIIDATTYPLTVNTGDRYILGTQTPIDSQWGGGTANQIAEYNGTSWDFITPEEGNNTFVDSEDKDARFVDDGAPAWELESTAISLFDGNGTTYDSINNKYDLGGRLNKSVDIDANGNSFAISDFNNISFNSESSEFFIEDNDISFISDYGSIDIQDSGISIYDDVNNVVIKSNSGGVVLGGDYISNLTANNLITKAYLDSQLLNVGGVTTGNGIEDIGSGTIGLGGTLTKDTTIDLDSNELNLTNVEILQIVSATGAGIIVEESSDSLRFGTGDGNGLDILGGTDRTITLSTADGSKVDLNASDARLALGEQVIISLSTNGARILDNINNNFVLLDQNGIDLTDLSNNAIVLNTNGILLNDNVNGNSIVLDSDGINLVEGVNGSVFSLSSTGGVDIYDGGSNSVFSLGTGGASINDTFGNGINTSSTGIFLTESVSSSTLSLSSTGFSINDLANDRYLVFDSDKIFLNDQPHNNFINLNDEGVIIYNGVSDNFIKLESTGILLSDSLNEVTVTTNSGGLIIGGNYISNITNDNVITKAYLDLQLGNISGDATNLAYVPSTRELQSSTGNNVTLPLAVASGDAGLITGTDMQKLDAIEPGAQVNVQSDWNATSGDSFIQNKPIIETVYNPVSFTVNSDAPVSDDIAFNDIITIDTASLVTHPFISTATFEFSLDGSSYTLCSTLTALQTEIDTFGSGVTYVIRAIGVYNTSDFGSATIGFSFN